MERIFLPFEQVRGLAQQAEGTGLGLAISQEIVAKMGSRLHVESPVSAPSFAGEVQGGPGSIFWFEVTLPVAEPSTEAPASPDSDIQGYEGARRRVLVVDDKLYNRELLVDLLEPLGFDVRTAGDGAEALHEALEWRPDAIVMDLMMPVMSGFEAAQEMRQRPELKDACIIASSASVTEADQRRSLLVGCDAFLPKPVRRDKLLELLESHLKLSWVRSETQGFVETVAAPLVTPHPEELAELFQSAQSGRVLDIRAHLARLAASDAAYIPFVDQLQGLVRDFEIDQLAELVGRLIEDGANEQP
jgi:CheY-like chemotaxis protein